MDRLLLEAFIQTLLQSRTNPMRRGCAPKVSQMKLWNARKPCVGRVVANAKIDIVNAAICPTIAKPAAATRDDLPEARIKIDAASGVNGMNQTFCAIQEFIL